MAGWFAGWVMEKVIDRCFTYLKDKVFDGCFEYFNDQVSWQKGIEEKLQRLRDIQPKIKAVISDNSHVEIKDAELNKWYWELRDAVDEADDVLDDFEYMKHEEQVRKNKRKRTAADPNLKKRLEEAMQKLDKVSAEVNCLEGEKHKEEQEQQKLLQTRETGSIPANVLLGRINEMEIFKKWVCTETYPTEIANNDLYRNISLLSVVGDGGMGKTTLLQHVYEDIKMIEEFDGQMWVCVSHNFDAKTVIKKILKSLGKQVSGEDSLEPLQTMLREEVSSKKFLLVLDDIWEYPNACLTWENVLCSLRDGKLGSKILITTRDGSVASNIPLIKNRRTFQLKGLEENECLELFNTYAFDVENPREHLKSIARDIVKKFSGSPLAAKLIGSSLKSQDESYWIRVLNNNIGDLVQNGLFPILKLTYTFLPKFLQNCFAFCCIFPQDHEFDKDDLVKMWIALGFIQSSIIPGETLEDEGRKYFNILVQKSFFDEFHTHNDRVYYKMHDLLHDLAQSVSKQECFRVVKDNEWSIPDTIRHLSIDSHSLKAFKKIGEFKNLRSLFLSYHGFSDDNFVKALSKMLRASKSIRLLYIYAPYQKEICEMTGCLTHLRYFNLRSEVVQLPRSISQLYHLMFLIYHHTSYNNPCVDLLPKDINNLHNLRYLIIPYHAFEKIYKIGKLKSLQNLKCFNVKNENGYKIGELEHMNELHQIKIGQLENIKDTEEAYSAKFYDKKNLTNLSLQWSGNRDIVDHNLDEKVLDSIQPYNNLKRLHINAYMGVMSAIWMRNVYLISYLEYIKLEKCLKWQTLPPFGQLRFLKSLYLHDMPEVEHIDHNKDCIFPSLEVLYIENLEALRDWFDTTVAEENRCLLPCLTELRLINCPKLQVLPSSPAKLQKLTIHNIGWKGCHWLPSIRNCSSIDIQNSSNLIRLTGHQKLKPNGNCEFLMNDLVINDPSMLQMEPLRSISSLRFLRIEKNDDLVSFPSDIEHWFLQLSSSLLKLRFHELQYLQSLPFSLENLPSLQILKVSNVPLLKLLPNPPVSLQELELYNLISLQCLPSSLSTISSLTSLTLSYIPLLKYLPDLPSSLKQLKIEKLESLQCLPSSLSTISSLTRLTLRNIPLLKSLPDLRSLSTISSLMHLTLRNIPLLKSLPDLPSSLINLELVELESLQCLPYSLSTISSLTSSLTLRNIPLSFFLLTISFLPSLTLSYIPLLKSLPDLPSSLKELKIEKLASLQSLPSSLSTISSLTSLTLRNIPLLKSLSDLPSSLKKLEIEELKSLQCLPSSLSTISSLIFFTLKNIPLLKSLPDLPSSLKELRLEELESLQYLPSSLSTISSLTSLTLRNIPLLKSLPELPSSLEEIALEELESLECLPSRRPTRLNLLIIRKAPQLLELPDRSAFLFRQTEGEEAMYECGCRWMDAFFTMC